MNKEKDFFKTCFNTVAGLEVKNENQAIAKEVVLSEIENLQQENKILRENAEHNDNVVDKVNWENQLLKKENKQLQEELECTIGIVEHNRIISEKNKEIHQLKNNWNYLKKYAKEIISTDNELYGTDLLDKMQELEQGSD